MSKRDPTLETKADRLLSGGRGPSVQEKEAMLAAVLKDLPEPAPAAAEEDGVDDEGHAWWNLFRWTPLLTAAACAVLFVVLGEGPASRDPGTLSARGPGDEEAPSSLQVACGAEKRRAGARWTEAPLHCPAGAPVLLRLEAGAEVTSWAAALYSEDGTLAWLLPDETGVAQATPGTSLDLRFTPPEAGAVQVLALFSSEQLTRDTARPFLAEHLEGGAVEKARLLEVKIDVASGADASEPPP